MSLDGISSLAQLGNMATEIRQASSVKEVAEEFEAILIGHMLQVMRESIGSSGLFEDAPGKDIYMGMMDEQVARALVRNGGLGLAEQIRTVLEGESSREPAKPGSLGEYPITSEMGWRKDPLTSEWRYHKGVDLAAPEGEPVGALTGGKVVVSDWQPGYGNTVVIEGPNGLQTRYAHLSVREVKMGEQVVRAQTVGQVGSTGRATGPHLHLEAEMNGKPIHPFEVERYLPSKGEVEAIENPKVSG